MEKNDMMTKGAIAYIISRLLENGRDAMKEYREDKSDYNSGRMEAYYELLDILQNELIAREEDLKEYGIDINLDKEF